MKHNPRYVPPRPLAAVPADGPVRFRRTLERYASDQISQLPPGSSVEVIVQTFRPVFGRLCFADPRMKWAITADRADVAAEWEHALVAASSWTPEGGDAA